MMQLLGDGPQPAKPPIACATRWAGQLLTLKWVVHSKQALCAHASDPASDTACLDDGSTYVDHVMDAEDWEAAEQMEAVLSSFTSFIHLMEQTKKVTISKVLPMVHKMLILLDPSKPVTVVDHQHDTEYEILVRLMSVTCYLIYKLIYFSVCRVRI